MSVEIIESEEDKKKKGQAAQPGSAFSSTGPSALSAKPTETQQARAEQTAGPTRGTGFTGVGKFLQANVGSRLGQQVAGRVSAAGQEAAGRLGQATQQFQQQRAQTQQQFSQQQQAAQSALQRIAAGQQEQAGLAPVKDSSSTKPLAPLNLMPSQEQTAAYLALTSGRPDLSPQLQDVDAIRSQARLAQQYARGTQTTAGRKGLLQQVVGRGPQQYTAGQSALDALLLGQSGKQLASARRGSAGLERKIQTEERLAEEQAKQFGSEFEAGKKQLQQEAGQIQKAQIEAIQKQQKAYEEQLPLLLEKVKNELASGKLSQESLDVLSQFGITEGTSLYGGKFQDLAAQFESKIPASFASSATEEQAAKLNALKRLAGQSDYFTEEEAKTIGQTVDPSTGLKMADPEYLKKLEETFSKRIQSISPDVLEIQGTTQQLGGPGGATGTFSTSRQGLNISNLYKDGKFNYENALNEYSRLNKILADHKKQYGDRFAAPAHIIGALKQLGSLIRDYSKTQLRRASE